jgi:hypothetical protein
MNHIRNSINEFIKSKKDLMYYGKPNNLFALLCGSNDFALWVFLNTLGVLIGKVGNQRLGHFSPKESTPHTHIQKKTCTLNSQCHINVCWDQLWPTNHLYYLLASLYVYTCLQ